MNFTSVSGKNWIFKKFNTSEVQNICETYSLSEIVGKLLSIRKKNIENIDLYLNPTIKNLLPNPYHLRDMKNGVDRVYKSFVNNDIIGIFGDYDVDGASSTALLKQYFSLTNQEIITYIPDRKNEGYGPTINGFNHLINSGAKIIFTVDCGTLSFEPIKAAQDKNIDVIVLDHHQSDVVLPKAHALINPNRYDETSKLNYLCAAGVCFVFLIALNKKLRDENWFKTNKISEPNILNFLDLVSLGTVCDVVPLVGLNRAIVKQGLKVFKKRLNLGLKTLYDLCKVESQPTTYDLGFVLGPRINAGGRVGKSSHGAELLSSNDPQRAYQIAVELDKYNKERKSIEFILTEEINSKIAEFKDDSVIVMAGENWHGGIIGIIAARIKDKYNKPTILITVENGYAKGSARSIVGFDIGAQILNAVQKGILDKGGGHKMAGGFSLNEKKINDFRKFLIDSFNRSNLNLSENKSLKLDALLIPSSVNEDFFHEINNLAPFGSSNSEPKFAVENVKVISSSLVGENHIRTILIGKDGSVIKSIAFNAKNTALESYLNKDNKKIFNIAGKIKLNEWKGKKDIIFEIEDISLN